MFPQLLQKKKNDCPVTAFCCIHLFQHQHDVNHYRLVCTQAKLAVIAQHSNANLTLFSLKTQHLFLRPLVCENVTIVNPEGKVFLFFFFILDHWKDFQKKMVPNGSISFG